MDAEGNAEELPLMYVVKGSLIWSSEANWKGSAGKNHLTRKETWVSPQIGPTTCRRTHGVPVIVDSAAVGHGM